MALLASFIYGCSVVFEIFMKSKHLVKNNFVHSLNPSSNIGNRKDSICLQRHGQVSRQPKPCRSANFFETPHEMVHGGFLSAVFNSARPKDGAESAWCSILLKFFKLNQRSAIFSPLLKTTDWKPLFESSFHCFV